MALTSKPIERRRPRPPGKYWRKWGRPCYNWPRCWATCPRPNRCNGVSRSQYYEYKQSFLTHGIEGRRTSLRCPVLTPTNYPRREGENHRGLLETSGLWTAAPLGSASFGWYQRLDHLRL